MKDLQDKIFDSFQDILTGSEEQKIILTKVIDMAVKEERGENIDANITTQTNNIIDSFIFGEHENK